MSVWCLVLACPLGNVSNLFENSGPNPIPTPTSLPSSPFRRRLHPNHLPDANLTPHPNWGSPATTCCDLNPRTRSLRAPRLFTPRSAAFQADGLGEDWTKEVPKEAWSTSGSQPRLLPVVTIRQPRGPWNGKAEDAELTSRRKTPGMHLSHRPSPKGLPPPNPRFSNISKEAGKALV